MKFDLPNREQDQEHHAYRIATLLAGYIRHTLSDKEMEELEEWLAESESNLLLFEEITSEQNRDVLLRSLDRESIEKARRRIRERLGIVPGRSKFWIYAAAACLLIFLSLFFYLVLNWSSLAPPEGVEKLVTHDVEPGSVRATLTLADGRQVPLPDQAADWNREQPGSRVSLKASGLLEYEALDGRVAEAAENVLTTPRGGRYRLRLPDGTRVWLNAASSLRYPTAFPDSLRRVYLKGEAYFEVSHDVSRPFRVELDRGAGVEVLGTRFNVMTYGNEPAMRATLLEGSVWFRAAGKALRLEPGSQASYALDGTVAKWTNVDTLSAVAWQRGEFHFVDVPLRDILRQVERWYDVDIVYQTELNDKFTADVSRGEPVSHVLELLELTKRVHFKIENKTIYVLP